MTTPPPGRLAHWLKAEWLLLLFGAVAAVLALADPQPATRYRHWLQLPTLAGLMGLMIAIQGICDSGLVQRAAAVLVARAGSLRGLGLLLVASAAVVSMVLTNDVSLFLLVPLTVAIGAVSSLPVLPMVVLEALAVNAGSALSPIGNPQNLLLWQSAHLPFFAFVRGMLPAAAVMLLLLAVLTFVWLPKGRTTLDPGALADRRVDPLLASVSLAALVSMVVLMEHGLALEGALGLLIPFGLLARDSLRRVDWALLATFAAIFLGLGHVAALGVVDRALDPFDFHRPLTIFLAGALASQLISNVPATVLLLDRSSDPIALAVAANVGGFGLVIGSLANLIALRLAKQPHGLRLFHRVSIPFFLVCAPLGYLAWRWLG
ncbi:SLC13 family permease [Dyella sp.]|uniref:SLC13 family permease n=1 Tax=Dyella sp. TaxID=1869338 RepID=UPI002D77959C|nr:SLC13 family permease [Dyella sp.]HET6433244.1 SLC13 family permease [Dyella sp.]